MIVECSTCNSKVDATPIGQVEVDFDGLPAQVAFVKCLICNNPLLAFSVCTFIGNENEYHFVDFTRLWPNPDNDVDSEIPEIARNSLIEAKMCYKAKAYDACAVMSGRAIEAVCLNQLSKKSINLEKGLKELQKLEIIDTRLFDWGEELRKHRNIGAHPSVEKISRENAKDLLDFAETICEYVFVLNAKFKRFQDRVAKDKDGS